MPSVTLHCHPALFYYWVEEHVIGKVEGLRYKDWPIDKDHQQLIIADVARLLRDHHLNDIAQRLWSCFEDITIHSENEELLCWVALAGPNKATPPRGL